MEDIEGVKTTIDFSGDLKMSSYWKQWGEKDVFTCIKYTRSGLVLLCDPDGGQVSVSKRNCNALKKGVKMESKKIVLIGAKDPEYPKISVLDSLVKPTAKNPDDIPEIVAGCLESVASAESFLETLKQVGSYAYRKKIHLSDVELANLLNENITAQLRVVRDYYLIWTFIHLDPKTAAKWDAFWAKCDAEIKNVIAGGGE